MKTISQIANENNVSVQTIYRKIKKLNIKPMLNDGAKRLTDDDEKKITDSLTPVKQPPNDSNIIVLLQDTIKTLQNQLSIKDNQIQDSHEQNQELNARLKELNESLKEALQLNVNSQVLLREEKAKNALPPVEKKLNLVERLFKREKNA